MALTLTLTIGPPCSGGGHFTLTGDLTPGGQQTFAFSKQEMAAPVTEDERATFIRVLVRLYHEQISGLTPAQIKAAIEGKTLDLTVP